MERLRGWRGQAQGNYAAATEDHYRRAWQRQGSTAALVDWLRFRRELGEGVGQEGMAALSAAWPVAGRDRQVALLELLLEAGQRPPGYRGQGEIAPALAQRSPAIAALLAAAGEPLDARAAGLASIHREQPGQAAALGKALREHAGAVCVVGNAGWLNAAGHGQAIDRHDLVVRFNRWRGPRSAAADIGCRCEIWACAPRFIAEARAGEWPVPRWLMISGPDARYGRAGRAVNWDFVLAMRARGAGVVTFDLAVWRELVNVLSAPPSAGLLFLAWAIDALGGPQGLALTGFGVARQRSTGYHHVTKRFRPGRRHHWQREQRLLDDWYAQGLRRLTVA